MPDPELRRRLTPDYEIGCKRIVLSNDWYPAIQAPNVELVSSGVSEVRERSVVDGDGIEREIDTLVFATGFKPAELPIAERLRGREGARWPRSGTAARRPTSARPRAASPTCSSSTART